MAGLKITFRKGIAYASGTVAGQRVRKSLGTRDKARAEEQRALLEARLWKRHSYGEEAIRTFEEAALSYIENEGERRFLPPIIKALKGQLLSAIAPEDIRILAKKLYPSASGATLNRQVLVPVKAVINHASKRKWCQPIQIESFPTKKAKRVTVDRDWIDAFLTQADKDKLPHLAAGVLFMWQTGTRISEAVRILPEHVSLRSRTILLERTKTDDNEECDITNELRIRIATLPQESGRPLFGYDSRFGLYRRMRAVCRRAKLAWASPHQAGRHSYATNALELGGNIREVMDGGRFKTANLLLETYAHSQKAGRRIADLFDTALAQRRGLTEKDVKEQGDD